MKDKQFDKVSMCLKLSCSALLISGSMIGYGSAIDMTVQAKETSTSHHTSESKDESFQDKIDDAKDDIDRLTHLKEDSRQDYYKQLDDVSDNATLDKIIEDAKKEDRKLKSLNKEAQHSTDSDKAASDEKNNGNVKDNEDVTKDLDKILADLDLSSENVDNHQQKDGETSQSQDQGQSHDTQQTSVLDDLDKIKQDTTLDEAADTTQKQKRSDSSSNQRQDAQQDSKDQSQATTKELPHSNAKEQETIDDLKHIADEADVKQSDHKQDGHVGKITKELEGSDKIDQAISSQLASNKMNDNQYINDKRDTLKALEKDVNQQSDFNNQRKQALKQDIRQTEQRMNQQHDLILNQLQQSKDKNKAAQSILDTVMSQNEAKQAMKHVNTEGKTDQQIANQIDKQLDGLAHTSSDNILKSMLDQSEDKQQLIKQLLATRLGDKEAQRIAKQLANGQLSNQQIVEQLKRHIDKQGHVSADDILNDVLNNAKDKRQAIETILATRIEQGKAKVLADIINRIQSDKASALDLIKSAINGKANDLLQLQHKMDSAKKDLDHIVSPIKNRPSIFDRMNQHSNQGSRLLDQLNSGGSLLDSIPDIPTPTPEKGLTLGSNDGFLDGLFNDDGNLSLPDAGQAVKQHWMPIALVIAIIGGSIIWFSQRKRSK
ncbi:MULTISPECIES: hypothetical protein [Staphylococcus]|mgnify:CR=1 FL=1|uniref:hypothetical protein n=1 Tax=Staphylococcus TaxID=1279 RepID=UPI0002464311|nr:MULTISPECIES: hypothetical protein [Staphylococcus]QAV30623.1 cell wall anchor protein [Sulfitobacter donghicola]AGZ25467.1 cell wall surface anchor family protein [Staphylococcus pasteuri SP1]KAB7644273.1 cell wall anchor protein [Staphylococcus sp. B2-b]MBN6853407.1 cell wall anchor protein [Staphylococcus warneri]MBT2770168.1 cell wall anchor protein [Staphylococcus warneri]